MAGSTPFQSLVRLLSARERTAADLRARLARKGFPPATIEASLERALALGWIDERRTAQAKAVKLAAQGLSRALIRQRLQDAGVGHAAVDEALSEAPPDLELARAALRRRFGAKVAPPEKLARYLASKGFELELVEEILRSRQG